MAFTNGVDVVNSKLSMAGEKTGSDSFTGYEDNIIVSSSGAVIKVTTVDNTTTANYNTLLGDNAAILAGVQYPNVIRVLNPDAGSLSEYYHYNNGGAYPFIPPDWSPLYLFQNTEQGVWYDPSDLTTLFQDVNGTTPVTADGDPVGLMLDKSKGLELGTELVTNGTFDSDVSGWANNFGGGALQWVNGEMRFYSTGTWPSIYGDLTPLTVGKYYEVTLNISSVTTEVKYLGIELATTVGTGEPDTYVSFGLVDSPREVRAIFYADAAYDKLRIWDDGVTSVDVTIDNISVKELNGNHATQAISASRPTYRRGDSRGVVNLFTWTEDLNNNQSWVKSGCSITSDAIAGPFITSSDKLVESGISGAHWIYQSLNPNGAATITIYAKAAERQWLQVLCTSSGNLKAFFDVQSGTVGTTSGTYFDSASIESVGSGWWRCEVTTTAISSNLQFGFNVSSGDDVLTHTGDGTSGIYLWGAQIENASEATEYQRNDSRLRGVSTGADTDLHWLEFDGVDDYMDAASVPASSNPTLVVGRYMDATMGKGGVVYFNATVNATGLYMWSGGRYGFNTWNGDSWGEADTHRGVTEVDTAYFLDGNPNSNGCSLYINGVPISLSQVNGESVSRTIDDGLFIGRGNSTTDQLLKGDIYGIVTTGDILSEAERGYIEFFIAEKSGVTL